MAQEIELAKIKGIIKRRKLWLVLPFLCVAILASVVGLILPDVYRSSATIMIQNPQIPANLVPSSVTSYADQRIQSITQEVTSRSKILNLVDKFDLLPQKRGKLLAEDLVGVIKKRIRVQMIDAEVKRETQVKPALITMAFELSYDDNDPRKAQLVAMEVTSFFMEKNHEARAKHARNTTQFLEEQLKQARGKVKLLEGRMAQFREENLEQLPEFTTVNMQKIEKLNAEISNLNMQIRSLEEQRATVRGRISLLDPFDGPGERVLTVQERLQQARLERAALAARYSEKHPLVQAKNQEISLLGGKGGAFDRTAQVREDLTRLEGELSDLKSRYTEKHPSVRAKVREVGRVRRELKAIQSRQGQPDAGRGETATNPAYIALKTDLEKAEVTISSMEAEKAGLEEQVKQVCEKLHSMPRVSKEYNEMTTDYQNAKANLTELQQKLSAAQLSQGMEEEQLGENFQVVEPAFLPEKPVKPNRLAIMLIGVVLGGGLAMASASFAEYSDTRIHDMDTLEQLSGLTALSAIPKIVTEQDRERATRRRVLGMTGVVCGVVVAIFAFHFLVMDLYVFYAKLVRFIERNSMI